MRKDRSIPSSIVSTPPGHYIAISTGAEKSHGCSAMIDADCHDNLKVVNLLDEL